MFHGYAVAATRPDGTVAAIYGPFTSRGAAEAWIATVDSGWYVWTASQILGPEVEERAPLTA